MREGKGEKEEKKKRKKREKVKGGGGRGGRERERKKGDRIGLARVYARLVEFSSSRYAVPGTLRWLRSEFLAACTRFCVHPRHAQRHARAWTRVT